MYVCDQCAERYHLDAKGMTTSNGWCEVCHSKRAPLTWTNDLRRWLQADNEPTVAVQLGDHLLRLASGKDGGA